MDSFQKETFMCSSAGSPMAEIPGWELQNFLQEASLGILGTEEGREAAYSGLEQEP